MKKRIIAIMFSLILVVPAFGLADGLKLVKGKGVPVCEAYLKNIKDLSLQEMVCGEKPETKDIKIPKWEKLDLRENKELLKKTEVFLREGDQFAKVEMYDKMYDDEKKLEWHLNNVLKNSFIRIASVDINNDGEPEKVLLYHARLCNIERRYYYARPLLILDENKNQIDVKKTEPLLQNIPGRVDIKAQTTEHLYRLYNVFFYRDETYFDKWFIYDWTLSVYYQSKGKTKEVCRYKYKFDKPLIKEDY